MEKAVVRLEKPTQENIDKTFKSWQTALAADPAMPVVCITVSPTGEGSILTNNITDPIVVASFIRTALNMFEESQGLEPIKK